MPWEGWGRPAGPRVMEKRCKPRNVPSMERSWGRGKRGSIPTALQLHLPCSFTRDTSRPLGRDTGHHSHRFVDQSWH